MTAELPWRQVVDRAIGNSSVSDRMKAVDLLLCYEASMSSQRMFELVNNVHHELADDPVKGTLPFAGKQMIPVGEFLQLRSAYFPLS